MRTTLASGAEVLCVDNFFSSTRENVEHLLPNPRFELMRHDVTFPLFVEVDEIYHLACPASPIHYQRDPVQTTKTSVHGSINMLGLAKRTGARILLASTSEVYGDPEVHPQVEEYWGHVNPNGIRSCYDEGKRCAETLFFDYHRQNQVDIKVARIFNTYGPECTPTTVEWFQLHRSDSAWRFDHPCMATASDAPRSATSTTRLMDHEVDGQPRRRNRSDQHRKPQRDHGVNSQSG